MKNRKILLNLTLLLMGLLSSTLLVRCGTGFGPTISAQAQNSKI